MFSNGADDVGRRLLRESCLEVNVELDDLLFDLFSLFGLLLDEGVDHTGHQEPATRATTATWG